MGIIIGGGRSPGGGVFGREGITPKSTGQNYLLNIAFFLGEIAIFILSIWVMLSLAGEMSGGMILFVVSIITAISALGMAYLTGTLQTFFRQMIKSETARILFLLFVGIILLVIDHLGVWSDLFLLRWWLTPEGVYYSWGGDAFQPATTWMILLRLFGLLFIPLYTIIPTGWIVKGLKDTLLARLLLRQGREIETPGLPDSVRTVPVDPKAITLADGTVLEPAPRGRPQQQEADEPPDWGAFGSQTEQVE